ncbi:hypothetical protein DF196_09495 [Bifidobacterium callitrichidarum]|uniref:Uncharacterized protein n=2 Tax=Bifidobacterium callitrichidarum TaxID=2052941 RepID=A0A2U2N4W2_9BIFI|nr:hypothetical protein DF196_09495 [Bifidobacterium callitrichidarum]
MDGKVVTMNDNVRESAHGTANAAAGVSETSVRGGRGMMRGDDFLGMSRQCRLTLRRNLAVYGVVLLLGLLLFVALCYQRLQALRYEPGGLSSSVDAEQYWFPILLLTAAVWQWLFFDTAVCHGVSRRTFVKASAIGGAIMALAVSVVMVASRYVLIISGRGGTCFAGIKGCFLGEPFDLPRSEQFLYAWQRVSYTGDASAPTFSPMLVGGALFMFLKFLSLMLSYVAVGTVLGAVLAWAAGKGAWGIVAALFVACLASQLLGSNSILWTNEWLGRFTSAGTLGNWLVQAASGRIISHLSAGVEFGTYVVWIPLVESLVLFALCVWIVYLMTARREIHPARQRIL